MAAPDVSACPACDHRVGAERVRRAGGFTLVELLVVIALVAIASGLASLALRDPSATRLEREAERLLALLEGARAEARAAGVPARWEPAAPDSGDDFRFIGLPPLLALPSHWQESGPSAEVVGARAVRLGPEPLIGAQRIVLRLDGRSLTLATDGLAPFAIESSETPAVSR